jgi:hypothetical protein
LNIEKKAEFSALETSIRSFPDFYNLKISELWNLQVLVILKITAVLNPHPGTVVLRAG